MSRSLLFHAVAAASMGAAISGPLAAQTLELEPVLDAPASEPVDSDAQARANAAPCGDATVAVVHADSGDTYVFCALDEGVATMELVASGDARASRIDRHRSPLELFKAVVPQGTRVPAPVLDAIGSGRRIESDAKRAMPFTVGAPRPVKIDPRRNSAKVSCPAPSNDTNGFDAREEFFGDFTYCGLVDTGSSSSSNTGWHHQWAINTFDAGGNEGSHVHAGPHYDFGGGVITYYADEDEDGGARFGRALVRSCSGTTRFRGWLKASPTTGSWGDPIADYYVPQGALYVMRLYANGPHSLWMGYDADDIRFRMDALDGATYGSRMYFAKYGWGTQCDINY